MFSYLHSFQLIILDNPKQKGLCIIFLTTFTATRSVHNQTQEDTDYDVITAYVMDDNHSMSQENELHSGPASVKVSENLGLALNFARILMKVVEHRIVNIFAGYGFTVIQFKNC